MSALICLTKRGKKRKSERINKEYRKDLVETKRIKNRANGRERREERRKSPKKNENNFRKENEKDM